MASVGTLTVLAVERYLLVCHRTQSLGVKGAYLIIVGVWMYALLLTVPPLFGWGSYVIEGAGIRYLNVKRFSCVRH